MNVFFAILLRGNISHNYAAPSFENGAFFVNSFFNFVTFLNKITALIDINSR